MESVLDNEKFISTIQSFPQLWDKRDPDYGDKFKKESSWWMVMDIMYGEEEIETWDKDKRNRIAKDVQKKWKNLRNSFARELAKQKNSKSGSGKAWKTYMYFDQMSFLIPSMAHVEVECCLSPLRDDEVKVEAAVETTLNDAPTEPQVELPVTTSKKRKSSRSDSEDDLTVVLAKILKWKQEKEEDLENDPDRLFLLSLLEDFKKVPSSRKADVKIEIISVISRGCSSVGTVGLQPPKKNK